MRVYAALYHAFMPPLYAGTLYQGLYQVYATRAPLGFIPGRSSSCKNLQYLQSSTKLPQYPSGAFSGTSCLMNPILPVCFMMAYAVALFCFLLVLCSTRSWPALVVLTASMKPAHSQYKASMWHET